MAAIGSFLAARYSDNKHGKISNWVIANEINARKEWNYMAHTDIETYVEEYAKAFRVFYTAIKSMSSGAKVYISLDQQWDRNIKNNTNYDARDVLDVKFKTGISESLQKILLSAAKAEVLSKGTPDFVDNGNGGKTLVFRDSTGNVLNNPANNLNPYTVNELLMQTSIKDAIDIGKQQQGSGTKPITTPGGNRNATLLDLSGVKNQLYADKAIEAYLLAQGITRDSEAFAEQSLQLRTENNVSQLPIR